MREKLRLPGPWALAVVYGVIIVSLGIWLFNVNLPI